MDWKIFLEKCSVTVSESSDLLPEFSDSPKQWLGFDPATNEQILQAEERLKICLPPSYKSFLVASNGFKQLSCFLWDFFPVEKIDWIDNIDPEFFELYKTEFKDFTVTDEEYDDYSDNQKSTNFKSEYLVNTLAVSNWGDSAIVLLNPLVKFGNEWEAWVFANWYPGAHRFKSFEELMLNEHQSYLKLRTPS
jgi:hypothetical protein